MARLFEREYNTSTPIGGTKEAEHRSWNPPTPPWDSLLFCRARIYEFLLQFQFTVGLVLLAGEGIVLLLL